MPLGISPLVDFAFKLMLSSHGQHITDRSKTRYAETTLDPGAATVRERSSSSIALANPTAPSRSRLDALGDAAAATSASPAKRLRFEVWSS